MGGLESVHIILLPGVQTSYQSRAKEKIGYQLLSCLEMSSCLHSKNDTHRTYIELSVTKPPLFTHEYFIIHFVNIRDNLASLKCISNVHR